MICTLIFLILAITCSSPPHLARGTITFISDSQAPPYDINTRATYYCMYGLQLVEGDRERTCVGNSSSVDGRWNGFAPKCQGMIQIPNFVIGASMSEPHI